ncbi:MAG: GGDEF domain-containing response regulator [Gammaproteobacteria bacterium]|jgi:diguanylate cyclase (GGDEF)-like protein|nr:MAG: GGDEF domain-containing response regulator [Gammaproteobacteria bacterium]PHR84698.1 MAG: GGDEF domain-containing response regulator [Colwellia sp.]
MDILLVDDDIVDRAVITRTLKKSNLSVNITEARTVDQGIKLYNQHSFDVILLDYNLPLRDGIEMVVEIRNTPKDSSTAIVMMSTSENETLALECIKAGAQDFLIKSEISEKRLRRAILHATTRHDLEKKLFETYQKVKILAETDSLTGLPNRYFFDESLKLALTNNRRNSNTLALLLLDLDNFKLINDNFGHDTGDIFLQKTVSIIKNCLRGNEIFARLGGDEFAITLVNLESSEHAILVAQRIINAMQQPLEVASTLIHSTVSIGIALQTDNSKTSEEIFKHADIAMYRSKKWGRNQACFFEDKMQEKFYKRLQIEVELRVALEKQQFQLFYQPVLEPKSGSVKGFEALIRWEVDGVMRAPDEFIKVAEETQQILPIGLWVIEQAISTLAKWNVGREEPFTMSINVSAVQLRSLDIVDFLIDCLSKHKVSAHLIEIELTETVLFKDTLTSRQVISALTASGCRLSLDDFGTGYSSIAHLRNYPISIVKIDKSLMPETVLDVKKTALVEGLVAMATILGLDIVAEGAETQLHVDLCTKLKIQRVQGYFYSRPKPQHEIEKMYL